MICNIQHSTSNIKMIRNSLLRVHTAYTRPSSARLVIKVASTRGKDGNVWYKLKCKFGLLQGWYRIGELMPYGEICNIAFDNEALISLREAARKENPNMVQRKKCMYQGPCSYQNN